MEYQRKGYPEEDEIVLCKVTKIYPNSVFVTLLEYQKQGMIHISEVSPGRIRNLRDFVSEGRQIVCKVLRLDKEKGHIDLSLRRVNSNQRREKLEEVKQENKAENLVKNIAKKLDKPFKEIYKQTWNAIYKDYSHLYLCFRDVVEEEADLVALGLPKKLADELKAAIIEKFKPAKIEIKGEITLRTYDAAGVERIRSTLQAVERVSPTIKVYYLGAGRYKFLIEDYDYKPAEKNLKKVQDILEKFNDKRSTSTLVREKSS